MISCDELYYLNKALDGKEIYGISPVENIEDAGSHNIKAKESLIAKKVIDDNGRINYVSYIVLESLEKYKKAEDYIWVNNSVVSIDDSDFLIYLKKAENNEFEFKKITKSIMVYTIFKENSFLQGERNYRKERKNVDIDRFISYVINKKTEDEVLYIRKQSRSKLYFYKIYYEENGVLLVYDVLNKSLSRCNPKDARIEIMKLFEIYEEDRDE